MAETRRDRVTLAALLAVLQDRVRMFIIHRMGPHECEAVAEGTALELRSTQCAEVCGDNTVERLALDLGERPKPWADGPLPVLIITIGGKEGQVSLFDPVSWYGKTSPGPLAQTKGKISERSSRRPSGLRNQTPPTFHYLKKDAGLWLTHGSGTDGPSPTEFSTRSFGESPSAAAELRLSQILEDTPPPKYSLSAKACKGILTRAERRGKPLPEELEAALKNQASSV